MVSVDCTTLSGRIDMADGRVARLTKTQSEFGVQLDSLADLITFGLAPAILMFQYGVNTLGRVGWVCCFIYMACGALRLARFNVQSSIGKNNGDFLGLPIPAAAGVIACYVALVEDLSSIDEMVWFVVQVQKFITYPSVKIGFLVLSSIGLALLMVSNVGFRSHKTLKLSGKNIRPFKLLAVLVVLIGVIAYHPTFIGFSLFLFYALSGPVEWLLGWKKPKDEDDIFQTIAHGRSIMEPDSRTPDNSSSEDPDK